MTESRVKNAEKTVSQVDLKVSEDKLKVLLSCGSEMVNSVNLIEEIKTKMKGMGIVISPDMESLRAVLEKAREKGENIFDLPIANGNPPILPEDARLEWTDDYFAPGYYIDPVTKRVDFHQKVEKTAVQKDQLLVRIVPAKEGKDGSDVFGRPIRVSRARTVEISAGPRVAWDPKEHGYRATCSGRVRMSGRTLDVDEIFHVRGDVGKDTGNIKHNGQLLVDGNIESDFEIYSAGNIEVRGLIYACRIECGGNLVAKEGINENIAQRITVKGDIITKYILNATIESNGNILVNKEIFQSHIKTSGEIVCGEGRIVGGEIMAAQGITVNEVGSKGNVKTTLIAGVDFSLLEKLKTNNDAIDKFKETIKKLTPAHKKLKSNPGLLSAAQKEGMMEISYQLEEAEAGINGLEGKNKEIRKEIFANKNAQIKITGIIYPGVILRIYDSQYAVEQALMGPLAAVFDKITGEVCLSSETEDKAG
jgi:uncharacterized protein (DUF342 family)